MKKSVSALLLTLCMLLPCFSREQISGSAKTRIYDYYDLRMKMTCIDSMEESLAYLAFYEKETESILKKDSLDYELENALLLNLSGIEYYTLLFTEESWRKELDEMMRVRAVKGLKIIDSLKEEENAHSMLYTATAETLSRYMFSSVSAVLKYGFRTKRLWEKTLTLDGSNILALVDLGQWYYFAPWFFGGSSRKAKKLFEKAWADARTDGEKYYAALYLSQFYFEKKKFDECNALLAEVEKICPKSKELAVVREQNAQKRSLFKFNRERSKLDEQRANMSDEDLKKGAVQ